MIGGHSRGSPLRALLHAGALLVFAAVTAVGAWCLVVSWHPLPFWDHWETVVDYAHFLRNGLDWGRLFAQHNEHRMVLSNLLHLTDYRWFGGGGVLLLAFNAVASCLIVAILVRCSGALRSLTRPSALLFCTAAGLSPTQIGNLAWSFQTAWFVVVLFAILALRAYEHVAPPRPDDRLRLGWLAGAWALAAAATFSNGNGVLVWIALLIVGAMLRHPRRVQLATGLAGVAVIAAYLHGYHKPAGHPSILGAIREPLALVEFMVIYAANSVQGLGTAAQVFVGTVVILVTLLCLLGFLARRLACDRDQAFPAGVAAFLLGTIALTAIGRLGLGGPGIANASRYVTYGWLLLLSAMFLVHRTLPEAEPRRWLEPALAVAVAVSAWSGFTGPPFRELSTMKRVRAAVTLCDRIDACTAGDWLSVYPDARLAKERMRFLREHRLSVFAPAFAPRLPPIPAHITDSAALPRCVGAVDAVTPSADGVFVTTGWMTRPDDRRELPDAVSIFTPDGRWIGGGGVVDERDDVQRNLQVRPRGHWRSYGFRAWSREDPDAFIAVGFFRGGAVRCAIPWRRAVS